MPGLDILGNLLGGFTEASHGIKEQRLAQEKEQRQRKMDLMKFFVENPDTPPDVKNQAAQLLIDMGMEHLGYKPSTASKNPLSKVADQFLGTAQDTGVNLQQLGRGPGTGSGNAKSPVGGASPAQGNAPAPGSSGLPMGGAYSTAVPAPDVSTMPPSMQMLQNNPNSLIVPGYGAQMASERAIDQARLVANAQRGAQADMVAEELRAKVRIIKESYPGVSDAEAINLALGHNPMTSLDTPVPGQTNGKELKDMIGRGLAVGIDPNNIKDDLNYKLRQNSNHQVTSAIPAAPDFQTRGGDWVQMQDGTFGHIRYDSNGKQTLETSKDLPPGASLLPPSGYLPNQNVVYKQVPQADGSTQLVPVVQGGGKVLPDLPNANTKQAPANTTSPLPNPPAKPSSSSGPLSGARTPDRGTMRAISDQASTIERFQSVKEALAKLPDSAFGPLKGRLEQYLNRSVGGALLPEDVQNAMVVLDEALAGQVFSKGGKQLTSTEIQTYSRFIPALMQNRHLAEAALGEALTNNKREMKNNILSIPEASRKGIDKHFLDLAEYSNTSAGGAKPGGAVEALKKRINGGH